MLAQAHPSASTGPRTASAAGLFFFSRVRRGRGSWWGTTRAVVGSTRCGGGPPTRDLRVWPFARVTNVPPRRRPHAPPISEGRAAQRARAATRRQTGVPYPRPRRRFVVPVSTAVPPTPPPADARPDAPTPRRHAAGTVPHASSLRRPTSPPLAAVGRCRCRLRRRRRTRRRAFCRPFEVGEVRLGAAARGAWNRWTGAPFLVADSHRRPPLG